ncbi:MAG: carbohydrate binding domain-containing protein [Prevotellaceae bacterium]|nr:carbohydrate binding domain-containing protein [Prevotellaceae bacterium]
MYKTIQWITAASLLLSSTITLQAGNAKVTNEPDSVYLFAYSADNGQGGLKFAYSADGNHWTSVAGEYPYLSSDFGAWGSGKKMFHPRLEQCAADGKWYCTWEATKSGKVIALATSGDLLRWSRQSYFAPEERASRLPSGLRPVSETQITLAGKQKSGCLQRVPYDVVRRLVQYAGYKRSNQAQVEEQTAQDSVRFAGLKAMEATITVDAGQGKPISENLIGIFFEDINYSADGGLYAELVQNRDFEYSATDQSKARWGNDYAWTLYEAGKVVPLTVADDDPLHANNPHYAVITVDRSEVTLQNEGYDGIPLKKGEKYDFSLFARVPQGSNGGKVKVSLLDKTESEVASTLLEVTSHEWTKLQAVLSVSENVHGATLAVTPQAAGTYHFDMISLFPQNTFKGRENGLRADLAQTLADLHPRFVRFPGGCVAHGNGIDNMYDWKGSIGPLEARKPLSNLWGYHQTRGLGYFEYFQFCEDIGAEPLPVLAAGVPCQNSNRGSHHSKDELSRYGQQGGIPMEEMDAYVQDILDLIEYANGDAKTTEWGKKRAQAGHPAPFNLKYIGIGNEDLITDVFEERFTMIYNAVREKHPEITVVGTVGPFNEGTDYDEGWALASKLDIPVVDEHYYVAPGWMINNQGFYDNYDRAKSKVYLGEYAAHLPGRPNNLETALAEALYLTSVERNGDVVAMTSYAPLLAKKGHTQWKPDLIFFDNEKVKPTVDYYTQQMYGQNAGTEYLPSTLRLKASVKKGSPKDGPAMVDKEAQQAAAGKRIGVSVVKEEKTGDYIVKLVNLLPVEVTSQVTVNGVSLPATTAVKTVLTGKPADKKARPSTGTLEIPGNEFTYTMPAYSFTVLRIAR